MTHPDRRHTRGIASVITGALLLTGCVMGEDSTDVTGSLRTSTPSALQIQVTQSPTEGLVMVAGGVGSGLLGPTSSPSTDSTGSAGVSATDEAYLEEIASAEATPNDPAEISVPIGEMEPGRHVLIVDSADDSRVATGRLDSGVATLPGLDDGSYTVSLLEITTDGWISGIGVVDLRISEGSTASAVPETHTRTLPVVTEQAQAGELIVNATPTAQQASPNISWRLVGPEGQEVSFDDQTRTTLDISQDGQYSLEIRAAQEGAPEVILQSVRYSFTVTDGYVDD